jgi:RND family efflux transporter MFP subunit
MSVAKNIIAVTVLLLAGIAGAQVPVEVEPATDRLMISQINVTGTVTSPRTAVLSTAVAGLVAELSVDAGHRVAPGDSLLTLDAELAELALQRTLAEARQRETELADSRRRLTEAEKVGEQRGIARTQIESLRAEVSSDEAALVAAEVAAREQRAIVERHTLRAPFGGVISERLAELGEWVNPGDGLLELVATDKLRFDFRVGQENYGVFSLQTPVDITLDALPDQSFPGRVDTIVPIKNPSARTFLVRVLADDSEFVDSLRITPGMSARAQFNIDAGRNAVAISRDAVLRFPDGRITVWIVDNSGDVPVVREQLVRTGIEFDGVVEVTSGLAAGDLVVVRGNETLQEGQTIAIRDRAL